MFGWAGKPIAMELGLDMFQRRCHIWRRLGELSAWVYRVLLRGHREG